MYTYTLKHGLADICRFISNKQQHRVSAYVYTYEILFQSICTHVYLRKTMFERRFISNTRPCIPEFEQTREYTVLLL